MLSGTDPLARYGDDPVLLKLNVSLLGKSFGAVGTNNPKVSFSVSIALEILVESVNVIAPPA